ncbi:MAG TPA: hypothetical protein VMG59_12730 [Phycisphaerae bacterium]|nr:hypothetical protein [Phycisphaerae bacterium]
MTNIEPQRIRSFQFYNIIAPRLIILVVFILLALLTVYIVAGAFPDRSFELSTLRGLTSARIVAKFGEPTLKYTEGDSVHFLYFHRSWMGYGYEVIFNDNHVVDVAIGRRD